MTRTRFAPSPTGRMHLGNLRTALFNALYAWHHGGRFLVRIENTDRERSDDSGIGALLDDLRWLGLDWDEGPDRPGEDFRAPQSERAAVYAPYYAALVEADRAYPCFCSAETLARARREQLAAGRPPRYPGTCAGLERDAVRRRLSQGETATLRFRVPASGEVRFDDLVRGPQRFPCADLGDFVIRRADGTAAFFFCNAVDDALMHVTHVLRGEDHLANTPRQLLLLQALGLTAPCYGHFGLIAGDDGAPLSKRHGSLGADELRAAGYRPEAVANYLARLGLSGMPESLAALPALAAAFDLEHVGRSPARYDSAQLDHWQTRAVQACSTQALLAWVTPAAPVPSERREAFVELVRPNVRFPSDMAFWAERLFGDWSPDEAVLAVLRDAGSDFFSAARTAWERHGQDWPALTAELKDATGRRGKGLFMPLRMALTGATHGPELAGLLRLLDGERIERRLRAAEQASG